MLLDEVSLSTIFGELAGACEALQTDPMPQTPSTTLISCSGTSQAFPCSACPSGTIPGFIPNQGKLHSASQSVGKRIPASLATLSSSGNQDSQVQPLPTFSEDEDEDEGLNRESSGSLLPNTVWSPLRAGGIRCSAPNGGR